MKTEVHIPWAASDHYRLKAWGWVEARWHALGYIPQLSQPVPWSQPRAVNSAAQTSSADILVIADADSWCDEVTEAIEAVAAGAAWAVPHRKMFRLTRQATDALIAGANPDGLELEEAPYVDVKGAGICAVRRDVLLDIPWDERFEGWSKFARAWRAAMTTCHGDPWRGDGRRWHLWHPPQPRRGRVTGSPESEALYARYEAARFDEPAIRELLKGARC